MNNACKSSHHTWCAPRSDTQHRAKTLAQLGVPLGSGLAPPATGARADRGQYRQAADLVERQLSLGSVERVAP
jgi:hypothetical protein